MRAKGWFGVLGRSAAARRARAAANRALERRALLSRMRGTRALLRRLSAGAELSSAAGPAAAAVSPLDAFKARLASGPDFSAFVNGKDLSNKEDYSVVAPPLKARGRAACGAARRASLTPSPRRGSRSRPG